jgi:outer membrane protein assembly factor BamB
VFFSAGTEGICCLDAETGDRVWQFDRVCVDSSPTVAGGSLYAGTTADGQHEVVCLDLAMGKPNWRTGFDLPVRAVTVGPGDVVLASLGNGTSTHSADRPAGAVICLDSRTGAQLWRYDVSDGVLAQPAVNETVCFGSRDGHCYALDLCTGKLCWTRELDSPVLAAPALAGSHLLVGSSHGIVYWLDAETGEVEARYDIAKYTRTKPWLFSSPVVQGGYVWFGVGLDDYVGGIVPRLFCLMENLAPQPP